MEFYEVLGKRFSVREFSNKKVDDACIKRVLNGIKSAPTAKNMNGVKVYAVTNQSVLEKLGGASPCIYGAPLVFAVCSDEDVCWKKGGVDSFGMMDASIYATYLMLALVNEGLGTCWVCMFDEAQLKKVLGIPGNIRPQCLIVAGYIPQGSKPSERHLIRPALDKTITEI